MLRFRENRGQSAALDAGFRAACGEVIVMLDADLQNDPRDIPMLLNAVQEVDCVCGVRTRRRDTGLRRLSGRVANGVRSKVLGDNISDIGCGLKAVRRDCLRKVKMFNGAHRFLPVLL